MTSKTYNWTGSVQTWRVPAGITSVVIDATGAMGAVSNDVSSSKPGRAQGTLAVTPGETLYIYVGGRGTNAVTAGFIPGGFNGGGRGGIGTVSGINATSGGGASDVRQGGTALSNRRIIAGGAGGRPSGVVSTTGTGGGTTGGAGAGSDGGGGGTASAGGAVGGTGGGGATAGVAGFGGNGGANGFAAKSGSGGGGGGYFGGGGGSNDSGTGNNTSGGGGGSGYVGGVTSSSMTSGYNGPSLPNGQVILTWNTPPNLATQSSPPNGSYTDQAAATVLTWVFSDNDPGDAQTSADIRYRAVGSGSWTTVTGAATTAGTYSITAATLTAGTQYEWQVQTYDVASFASGWTNSWVFTPVAAPSAPTRVSPTAGTNITNDPTTYTWTPSGTQNAYQVQMCGDTAGSINTAVVYLDTGTVLSTATSYVLDVTPPGSGVTVHVRVRTFANAGAWSPWTEWNAQLINLAPPGTPTVVLSPDLTFGRISIAITNPATPNVTSYNQIYRTDQTEGTPEALWTDPTTGLTQFAANATVFDPLVAFGHTYRYRVVAFSAPGGQTSST